MKKKKKTVKRETKKLIQATAHLMAVGTHTGLPGAGQQARVGVLFGNPEGSAEPRTRLLG